MATPPLKTEISDTYPNPTNAVARAGFGKLYDYVTGLLGATGDPAEARVALGAAASGSNSDITALTAISSLVFEGATADDFETVVTAENPTADNAIILPNKSGTLAVIADIAAGLVYVPTRQTVLSGPVDTNGYSAFGGSTGSTTVTATGTIIPTAANGFNSAGAVNRIGSITSPSWTTLSTNGTMYLYMDIAANGSCTTGSTTLEPKYRWGGADVTTSGQFTFNIQEMVGKVGNGTVAVQTYRTFVGEVTVAGGVVTAIKWYALQGRYDSGFFSIAASTTYAKDHLIGCVPMTANCYGAMDANGLNMGSAVYFSGEDAASTGGFWVGNLTRLSSAARTDTPPRIKNVTGVGVLTATHLKMSFLRGW